MGVACLVVGVQTVSPQSGGETLRYINREYGFRVDLPGTWRGYSVQVGQWQAADADESGPRIVLRHPGWTDAAPREDMPILVFTHRQWDRIQDQDFVIGAEPVPPDELGENSKFVFGLAARYNYDYLPGWEEVDQLIHRLAAIEPSTK